MNHLYLSANQNHQKRPFEVWKFLWAVSLVFSAFLAQAQTTYYVNDNSTTSDRFTTAIGNNTNDGLTGATPFATIDKAVTTATDGDLIYVDAGTYDFTSSLVISKALRIYGANYDVSASSGATRNAESIINLTTNAPSNDHISLSASGAIEIKGFRIEDNLLITSSTTRQAIVFVTSQGHIVSNNYFFRDAGGINGAQNTSEIRAIFINPTTSGSTITIDNNLFTGSAVNVFNNQSWRRAIWKQSGSGTVNITNNKFANTRSHLNLDESTANTNISGNTFNLPDFIGSISFGTSSPTPITFTMGANNFTGTGTYIQLSGTVPAGSLVDATACTLNGTSFGSLSLADQFNNLEQRVNHGAGLIRLKAGTVFAVKATTPTLSSDAKGIQFAVNRASSGDIVNVQEGTYDEQVSINKALNLKGANAGTPGNGTRVTESILTGNNGAHSGFVITSSNVTIDGFTVTGAGGTYGAGVYSSPATSAVTVKCNIITDNVIGVYPSSNGASFVNNNLFNANNRAGASGGAGLYVEETNTLTVELNEFKGHTLNSAVLFGASASNKHQNLNISRNYIHDNNDANSMVYLNGVTNGTLSYNNIAQSGATAIKLAGGNSNVTLVYNELNGNATGVKIQNDGPGPNTGIQIHENSIVSTTAINNLDVASVDATCNWYGSNVAGDVAAKVSGPVTYLPFTNNGTDNNGAGIGFEPVPGSCVYPVHNLTHPKDFATIQLAINDANTVTGDVIQADNGTYNEDVTIHKAITLQGESRNGTIIKGLRLDNVVTTGSTRTVNVTASNVTIKNLTVTRDYNGNEAGWKASTKTEGIIIENQDNLTLDNVLAKDNRTGVYLHNTKNTIVKNSEIVDNWTGFQVWGPLDNTQIINNFINGNFTHGIVFNFDQGPTRAPGMQITNNNISGNWYTQISFQRGSGTPVGNVGDLSTLDLTCNWYGAPPTTTVGPVIVTPGYSTRTTSQFGGTAPATTLYIAGEEAAGKNVAPFLNNGTDNDGGTAGFQPVPGSCVAPVKNLTHPKSFATIQAAIDDAITVSGDVIEAIDGTYNEDVIINKSVTVQGTSATGTIIRGLYSGAANANTVTITAPNVTLKKFTVTRDYCADITAWNNSTKNQGININANGNGAKLDELIVKDNRNGVYINNAQSVTLTNSIVKDNRTGVHFANNISGADVENNIIQNNFTHGVLFNYDTAPGIVATNVKVNNNSITGNWYAQVNFQHNTALPTTNDHTGLSFSCNWYGTATISAVAAAANEPGYTAQAPSQFGGTDPGLNRQLYGTAIAQCPYIPYLNNGTDNDGGTAGFQPVPGSCVSPIHNLTHAKDFGTIQAAINDPITEPGDVIKIDAGTYTENFTVTKNLTFEGANKDVCGTATRGAETILVAPAITPSLISLGTSVSATFNGFLVDGMAVASLNDPGQSLTIKNSVFELDFIPSQNNLYSNGGAVTLDCNYFKAIGGTNDGGGSSHIFIGNGAFTATNNKFTSETAVVALTGATTSLPVWLNLTGNTNSLSVQGNLFTKVDIGILLASNAGGGTIQNNEFSEAKRNNAANGYGTGIAIFGNYTPAAPVSIQNNKFYNSETGIRTSSGDASNSFPATNLLTISNNSFETLSAGSFRIGASYNSSTNALNATCNWFNNAAVVTGNPANITYLPKLVSGTDESSDLGFQQAAPVCVSPIQNLTHPKYFATIQAAINDPITEPGDVIKIDAGTYTENFTVTKSLTFEGANKDVCGTATRSAETVLIAPATETGVITLSGSVTATFNGFLVDGLGIAYFTQPNESLILKNSVFELDFLPGKNNLYAASTALTLDCNYFKAIGGTNDGSSSHIFVGGTTALSAINNTFTSETALGSLTGATKRRPVWLNLTDNSTFTVKNNLFTKIDNSIVLASTSSGLIEANEFSEANRVSPQDGSGYGTGVGIFRQYNPAGPTLIQKNKFYNSETGVLTVTADPNDTFSSLLTFTNNSFETLGASFAIANSYNASATSLNATCNWFNNAPVATGNPANITYLPKLVSGTDDAPGTIGFQTSAACVSPIQNLTHPKYFATIQAAINDPITEPGDVIKIDAGTYTENFTVTKNLTFEGANKDVCGTATRSAETVLTAPPTETGVITLSGSVTATFNGLYVHGLGVAYLTQPNQGLVFKNSVFKLGFLPGKNNLYAASNTLTLDCNYFQTEGGTNDGSASHIFVGGGTLTVTNNKFTSSDPVNAPPVWLNITANTSNFSVQNNEFTKIDIGILLAANAGNGTIQNNEFSDAKRASYTSGGGFGAGIAIFGNYTPSGPVSILNNKFFNSETGIRTSSGDASNNFPAPNLLTISNNSFETLSAGSFRIGASYNSSVNSLSATCNWFNNAAVVTGNPANITYLPKLVSGTDDSPAIGFQTSAACLLPVHNITKNTYFATIQGAINDPGTTNGDEIVASDGTYNERVTVSKQVKLTGTSKAGTIIDGAGLAGTGSGIFINDGITNVTIKNFMIQNFTGSSGNSNAGIYANAGNNNLTITDVIIKNNPSASGIYANGPVSDVLIDKVDALNNGPSARGIVIWNGLKKNITITNSNVQSNTCCGIELQDGSATGVLIKGNTIVGNDNAIGLVGLTSGSGLGKANIIENNVITVNGRFGIEVKNPNGTGHDVDTEDGAIIIRSNTVTFGSTTDQRDLAGIAVYRRGVLAGNVDVPTGVVVKNNTVSGFKQSSSSDGFGIVIEGTNHTVTGNTLNNNDVGIQLQAGYGGYPGDGDQSNLADTYFGRGNSPLTCGNIIAPNTYSGNAANTQIGRAHV